MRLFAKSLIAASIAAASMGALAMGGGSGPATNYIMQGHIGEVMMNPYGIAPLTAVIRDGGYDLSNVVVKIQPKLNGQTIEYKVSRTELLTHGGVPVFGLYPDYVNMVEVSYTRTLRGNSENFKDTYQLYAPPTYTEVAGIKAERHALFGTEVKKVDPEFKDRLYFINNIAEKSGIGTRAVWNNPVGGALQWNFFPQNAIIDTAGDIRWYMFANPIYDLRDMYKAGVMMGFKQNDDGLLTWGYGQRYVKYDIMGREVFNRLLPMRYNDYSHSMDDAQNGHYFLRVASSNYIRPDGKHVRTVRDVIAEVDEQGHVIDEWRLPDILDVYRSNVLKVLDQGAVCLNIDAAQAGKTLTAEELFAAEESNDFGDIVGTGAGRTGCTSTPSTMTRKTTPSSFPPAISRPSSRSAATRRSSGSSARPKAGRATSPRRSSSPSTRTVSRSPVKARPARATSTGRGRSTRPSRSMKSPRATSSTSPPSTTATPAAWNSRLCPT